jgi:HAMP domain-containing protein
MKTIGIDISNAATASFIANDLTGRIRKLRWMGMEDEAKELERELKAVPTTEIDTVLGAPRNTD